MAIDILPTDAPIGAEIKGLDLSALPTPDEIDAIETAMEHYGVLIFRGQDLEPGQQVAWSRVFAELAPITRVDAALPEHPEIFVVGNTGKRLISFAPADGSNDLEWHSDHMHMEVPARASMFHCVETPPTGGATLFACMYSAYDALSPAEKAEADGLTACHSISGLQNFLRTKGEVGTAEGTYASPETLVVKWPLVRTHPLTGRKALYFGSKVTIGIEGWEPERAHAYITDLNAKATVPAFRYGHQWAPGDTVLWDNRRVLHAGTPYDTQGSRRRMHRTTWREDRPIA